METRKVIRLPKSRTYRREQQVELSKEEKLLKNSARKDLVYFIGSMVILGSILMLILVFVVRLLSMLP